MTWLEESNLGDVIDSVQVEKASKTTLTFKTNPEGLREALAGQGHKAEGALSYSLWRYECKTHDEFTIVWYERPAPESIKTTIDL
jgi:hypothetical protein